MFTSTFDLNLSEASIVRVQDAFKCKLMPAQVTDVFYASFIQWLHERASNTAPSLQPAASKGTFHSVTIRHQAVLKRGPLVYE